MSLYADPVDKIAAVLIVQQTVNTVVVVPHVALGRINPTQYLFIDLAGQLALVSCNPAFVDQSLAGNALVKAKKPEPFGNGTGFHQVTVKRISVYKPCLESSV
ncbi:MAG: hypothetical protein ABJ246_03635 [Paracoccaceae bacterium]